MSLSETKEVDQITITENGIILYRETTTIFRNGEPISKVYHRMSLIPGQDLTDCPEKVVTICNVVWTPEVISNYAALNNSSSV